MRYAHFIVTFDLADNSPATIKARLADDDIEVIREDDNYWSLHKGDHSALVRKLGVLGNGDTVFLFIMPAGGRDYLRNQLGASKVVPLMTAWNDATVRPALGNMTAKQWLLANGFSETSSDLGDPDTGLIPSGSPIPPMCMSGQSPAVAAAIDIEGE
jgi:hypothetical protein